MRRRVPAHRRPGVRRPRRGRGSAASRRTRSTCPCCRPGCGSTTRRRCGARSASCETPTSPTCSTTDSQLPAALRARRRRPRAGAHRGTPRRHPARAAQLVDPLPRGRARPPRSARPSSGWPSCAVSRRGRPAGSGWPRSSCCCWWPRRSARSLGYLAVRGSAAPGVRPGHRGGLHLAGAAHRAGRRGGRARHRRAVRRGRCSGGRCPSCCAGCRRGAPGARPGWSTASSWCSPPRASCSWSATAAAGRARWPCWGRAWSRWPAGCWPPGSWCGWRAGVRPCRCNAAAPPGWSAGPASRAAPARPGSPRCSRWPPAC